MNTRHSLALCYSEQTACGSDTLAALLNSQRCVMKVVKIWHTVKAWVILTCVYVCLCVLPCSSLLCTWRAKQSQPRWAELWGSLAVCVTVETKSLEDDSHLKMFLILILENKLLPETRLSAPKYSFQANRVWSIVPWWHQHWPSTSRRSA